jgi:hypothetical protein
LQQWQIAWFIANIVKQAFGQSRFTGDAAIARRLFDGAVQFLASRHRAQHDAAALQCVSQRAMRQRLVDKIGAHGDDQRQSVWRQARGKASS